MQFKKDPYSTKRRRFARGNSPRHQQRRAFSRDVMQPRMRGLQAMEVALRQCGVSWRQFMQAVYAGDGEAINRYRGMVANGASGEHIQGSAA